MNLKNNVFQLNIIFCFFIHHISPVLENIRFFKLVGESSFANKQLCFLWLVGLEISDSHNY